MASATAPVLEFERVTVESIWPYNTVLWDWSLRLQAGELALVLVSQKSTALIADLAQGLFNPTAGTVRFLGQSWLVLARAEATRQRRLIGRIFSLDGWVSNLDVDENILLAQRHYSKLGADQIDRHAVELACQLGLEGLPRERPALLPLRTLCLAQWVRALLGDKRLLVLEEPLQDVDANTLPALAAALTRARTNGTSVLWITGIEKESRFEQMNIEATLKCCV